MSQGEYLGIFKEAVMLTIKLSAPFLVVSLVIGLVIAIFQAATQIHEQTITFVPKALAIAIMLIMLGPWSMTILAEFFEKIFAVISGI
ncbi:MAG: flagellar biosynthesis protein FliQ [Oscillospiraceae bacterium]